jgi:Bacteriophage Sf6, terminase small subunit-like
MATGKKASKKPPVKKKRGRPTKYSPEIAKLICDGIVENKPLLKICEVIGIHVTTLRAWRDVHSEFSAMYARAREIQTELWEDMLLQSAWDNSNDDIFTEDGKRFENKEWTSRSKLKMEALKWLMSKRLPKKYGDRLNLDHDGEVKLTFTFGGEEDGDK